MSDADVSTTNRGDLTPTIMGLNSSFLNASIESLSDLEPVFPSNYDVVHGQYLHRTDSVDIDLFRFVVDLDDPTQVGTLTAETFSERLADSSLLDTELTLFEEVSASVTTDFGLGSDMVMQIESLRPGRLGNNAAISFVQSDRGPGDTEIRVLQALDQSGNPSPNGILVNLPRLGPNVSEVLVSDLVDAINNHPFASSILRATVTVGDASTDIAADQPPSRLYCFRAEGLKKFIVTMITLVKTRELLPLWVRGLLLGVVLAETISTIRPFLEQVMVVEPKVTTNCT